MTDSLSDVLSLLEVRDLRCTRLEAGGRWALAFSAKPLLKFVAVLRGGCWIACAGDRPHRLGVGDAFLLADAPPYVVAEDPAMDPADGDRLFARSPSGAVRVGGGATVLVGGGFAVGDDGLRPLLGAVPPFQHVPAATREAAAVRDTLRMLDAELGAAGIGGAAVARRLADVLLVQALRAGAAGRDGGGPGWVGALADRRIGAALALMHGDPGHGWTVGGLAAAVGMSRSAFALRFKTLVGVPPLDHLLRWRMRLARAALRRDGATVASVAFDLGYSSESAFGAAYKRVYGRAPGRHRYAGAERSDGVAL